MVLKEDNIDSITKEIYEHAAKKLGTKSLTHSKRLFPKKSTASGQSSTQLSEYADSSSKESTGKVHSHPK